MTELDPWSREDTSAGAGGHRLNLLPAVLSVVAVVAGVAAVVIRRVLTQAAPVTDVLAVVGTVLGFGVLTAWIVSAGRRRRGSG